MRGSARITVLPDRAAVRAFQGLGELTRLRIVALLAATGERACVCELSDALDEAVYKVSRHLSVLQGAGLLASTREGRWIYYEFVPSPAPFGSALGGVVSGLAGSHAPWVEDRRRFAARLALRKAGRCVIWKLDPGQLERAGVTRGPRAARTAR